MKYKINDEVIVKSTGRTTYIIGIRNNEYQLNDHRMSGCNCYREYELEEAKIVVDPNAPLRRALIYYTCYLKGYLNLQGLNEDDIVDGYLKSKAIK